MYGTRWADALHYKYCRAKHYLLGSILSDNKFTKQSMSYGQKILFDGCGYDRNGWRLDDLLFVGIIYDPETYEILSFECMCEWDQSSSHYRPYSSERPVTSGDKQLFYKHFNQFVTKDPEAAKQSWT